MKYSANQRGLVSILTAAFFSLLVIVVTIGTLAVQTRELRQSTDDDQSTRAYFAAQAVLETAIKRIRTGPIIAANPECLTAAEADAIGIDIDSLFPVGSELEITCLQITDGGSEGKGALAQEKAEQFKLHGRKLGQIDLKWHNVESGLGFVTDPKYTSSSEGFPNAPKWSLPPVIELTVFSYPRVGFTIADIQAKTILLRPRSEAAGGIRTANINETSTVHNIICDQTVDFACRAKITGFVDNNDRYYVVRLRPRYNTLVPPDSSSYGYLAQFSPDNSCLIDDDVCPKISVNASRYRIEVTARAGDVFRRLVAHTSNEVTPYPMGLDYVIFSQSHICKNMTVPYTTKIATYGC